MPQAGPPLEPIPPAPLSKAETDYIKEIVVRFYGDDAVVRNYGPDPSRLQLHVETNADPGMERHECLGLLMCEINRDYVSLEITKRGSRVRAGAKIAYRQGDVL
jgi:integrase